MSGTTISSDRPNICAICHQKAFGYNYEVMLVIQHLFMVDHIFCKITKFRCNLSFHQLFYVAAAAAGIQFLLNCNLFQVVSCNACKMFFRRAHAEKIDDFCKKGGKCFDGDDLLSEFVNFCEFSFLTMHHVCKAWLIFFLQSDSQNFSFNFSKNSLKFCHFFLFL